jgi:hypothetical protein
MERETLRSIALFIAVAFLMTYGIPIVYAYILR